MDKWEKLVLLHRTLRDSRYCVPLKTLLEELDCSEATFHRIRGYLQDSLGAPILYDRRYGGYRYCQTDNEPFELPGFWLTKNEIEALLCFDHAIENLQAGLFKELFRPLRSRLEPLLKAQKTSISKVRDRIKILSINSRECDRKVFSTVAGAVLKRKRITIGHRSLAAGEVMRRTISPHALVRYRDNWYVDGFCHLRNEPRTFALNRITTAETAPGRFKVIPAVKMKSFYADTYGIFTGTADKLAVIDFTGIAAREVSSENWHPRQQGTWTDEETYRLTIPFGDCRELVMDILRWGDKAEVREPQELREKIRGIVEGMKKNYDK